MLVHVPQCDLKTCFHKTLSGLYGGDIVLLCTCNFQKLLITTPNTWQLLDQSINSDQVHRYINLFIQSISCKFLYTMPLWVPKTWKTWIYPPGNCSFLSYGKREYNYCLLIFSRWLCIGNWPLYMKQLWATFISMHFINLILQLKKPRKWKVMNTAQQKSDISLKPSGIYQ